MENLDNNNITAAIQISTTDDGVVVGETRGHYSEIMSLFAIALLNLQENTNLSLKEIGEDLNKAVKVMKEQRDKKG